MPTLVMRLGLSGLLACWFAGLAWGDEPQAAWEPDFRQLTDEEAKASERRIRVDVSFPGRADNTDNHYAALGQVTPLELRCSVRCDVRTENIRLWVILAKDAKGRYRIWKNADKTAEILPQLEGSSRPYDTFGVDDLPGVIWIENFGVGQGTIGLLSAEWSDAPQGDK